MIIINQNSQTIQLLFSQSSRMQPKQTVLGKNLTIKEPNFTKIYTFNTENLDMQIVFTQDNVKVTISEYKHDKSVFSQIFERRDPKGSLLQQLDKFQLIEQNLVLSDDVRQSSDNKYELGTIKEINGIKKFKVEQGGKATVYGCLVNSGGIRGTRQTEIKLKLKQVQKIPCEEIIKRLEKQLALRDLEIQNLSKKNERSKQLFPPSNEALKQPYEKTAETPRENIVQEIIKPKSFARTDTPFAKHFRIECNSITRIKQNDNKFYQVLFSQTIPLDRIYTFALRITKTFKRQLSIGVVKLSQSQQRSSQKSGEATCYVGSDGTMYPGKIKEGNGFKQTQIVVVKVNRSRGFVQWIVDGETRATNSFSLLSYAGEFVPYVEMADCGDSVIWEGSSFL